MATSVVFIPMRIAFPFGFLFAASACPALLEHFSLEKEVALSGNDAVSYHQGTPKMSEGQWNHQYGGARCRFASKAWRHSEIIQRRICPPVQAGALMPYWMAIRSKSIL